MFLTHLFLSLYQKHLNLHLLGTQILSDGSSRRLQISVHLPNLTINGELPNLDYIHQDLN